MQDYRNRYSNLARLGLRDRRHEANFSQQTAVKRICTYVGSPTSSSRNQASLVTALWDSPSPDGFQFSVPYNL
jgi:hypothetical protein